MKKELSVEGMMCPNCVKHVTNALNAIEGAADVTVSLEAKTATLSVPETVTDEMLKAAVTEEGYKVDSSPGFFFFFHITTSYSGFPIFFSKYSFNAIFLSHFSCG